ncbi:hypothetical protein [Zunongwangia profunda]|jgi:hypothetical protein|uniref:hypothetical protein n=1 Tax=Zunongwangia profunda TaxID=398743 RepID=UPI00248F15C1|nr:hypothetical protein [Zunongwangia profunda]|tara:strand:+ start:5942 stop:6661 length:720 start_codon:yes stop_codon:yes gene_type:complete
MKTTKRTLMTEDKTVLKSMSKDLVQIRPTLSKLVDAYLELEIGEFSNEIFHNSLGRKTAPIREKYFNNIKDEIRAAGIKSSVVQKTMMNGAEDQFQNFLRKVDAVLNFDSNRIGREDIPVLNLKNVTYFDHGAFELSAKDTEDILEKYCRKYLEGDQEHETYEKVKNFLEVFKDLTEHFDKIGYRYANEYSDTNKGMSTIANSFFDFKGDKITIRPNSIRWAVSGQKEELEKRTKRFSR